MRASVASISKKFISAVFAATLALGLVPAAALAEDDASSLLASAGVIANEASSTLETLEAESVTQSFALHNAEGEDASTAKGNLAIVSREQPLVVAQVESTRTFFLAETLESTKTVPMVSAMLPIADGTSDVESESAEGAPAERDQSEAAALSADFVVVGSFTCDGITYAIEPDGKSVAAVAVDSKKLPTEEGKALTVVLPSSVSPDADDAYHVVRIASGFGIGLAAVAVEVPSSVESVDDEAFAGASALELFSVADDSESFSSFDGCLYTADRVRLILVPEGKQGEVRIPPEASEIVPNAFSQSFQVTAISVDEANATFISKDGRVYTRDGATFVQAPVSPAEEVEGEKHSAVQASEEVVIAKVGERTVYGAGTTVTIANKSMGDIMEKERGIWIEKGAELPAGQCLEGITKITARQTDIQFENDSHIWYLQSFDDGERYKKTCCFTVNGAHYRYPASYTVTGAVEVGLCLSHDDSCNVSIANKSMGDIMEKERGIWIEKGAELPAGQCLEGITKITARQTDIQFENDSHIWYLQSFDDGERYKKTCCFTVNGAHYRYPASYTVTGAVEVGLCLSHDDSCNVSIANKSMGDIMEKERGIWIEKGAELPAGQCLEGITKITARGYDIQFENDSHIWYLQSFDDGERYKKTCCFTVNGAHYRYPESYTVTGAVEVGLCTVHDSPFNVRITNKSMGDIQEKQGGDWIQKGAELPAGQCLEGITKITARGYDIQFENDSHIWYLQSFDDGERYKKTCCFTVNGAHYRYPESYTVTGAVEVGLCTVHDSPFNVRITNKSMGDIQEKQGGDWIQKGAELPAGQCLEGITKITARGYDIQFENDSHIWYLQSFDDGERYKKTCCFTVNGAHYRYPESYTVTGAVEVGLCTVHDSPFNVRITNKSMGDIQEKQGGDWIQKGAELPAGQCLEGITKITARQTDIQFENDSHIWYLQSFDDGERYKKTCCFTVNGAHYRYPASYTVTGAVEVGLCLSHDDSCNVSIANKSMGDIMEKERGIWIEKGAELPAGQCLEGITKITARGYDIQFENDSHIWYLQSFDDGERYKKTCCFTVNGAHYRYPESYTVTGAVEVGLCLSHTGTTSTVSFDANGGSGGQFSSVIATYGQAMPTISTVKPTRSGHAFQGWYDTSEAVGGTQYYTAACASARNWDKTANTTLYARWTANAYPITWNAGGGSVLVPSDVAAQIYGNSLKLPANPTRRGYKFVGWWTARTGGTQVGVSGGITNVEARNAEYFARWSAMEGKVTLSSAAPSDTEHAGARFSQAQVDSWNAVASNPRAVLKDNGKQVELTYGSVTAAFPLDSLRPVLLGFTFNGWDPAVSSFDPANTPSWDALAEAYGAASYAATWTTNAYSITYAYQNQDGGTLTGAATVDGGSLPASFNEATTARDLPAMELRGYSWRGWTYEGDSVTAIPDASKSITLVGVFDADPYPVSIDFDGGMQSGWHEGGFDLTYDDPVLRLPANNANIKKAGYVLKGFEAYAGGASPVTVYEQGGDGGWTVAAALMKPGKSYKTLGLGSGSDVYDIFSIKAVWEARIAVDVPQSVSLGVLADMASNSLKFQSEGTIYDGSSDDAYAPVAFVSYTTAPVGIVEVVDARDEVMAELASEAFCGKEGTVSLALSSTKSLTHKLALGGKTSLPSGSSYLPGMRLEAASADGTPSRATFWLGMDFAELKVSDLQSGLSGDIAKLVYTVCLLKDDGSRLEVPVELPGYDGKGALW